MKRRMRRRIWKWSCIATFAVPVFASAAEAKGKFAPVVYEKYLPNGLHPASNSHIHTAGVGWLLILVVITVTALLVCAWLWQTVQRSLVVRRGRKAASASYAVPS